MQPGIYCRAVLSPFVYPPMRQVHLYFFRQVAYQKYRQKICFKNVIALL